MSSSAGRRHPINASVIGVAVLAFVAFALPVLAGMGGEAAAQPTAAQANAAGVAMAAAEVTLANQSTTVTSMFIPDNTIGTVTVPWTASVVTVHDSTTVFEMDTDCAALPGDSGCDFLGHANMTFAPNFYQYTVTIPVIHLTVSHGCKTVGTTEATCTNSISAMGSAESSTSTLKPTDFGLSPVTIMAGLEKLPSTTATSMLMLHSRAH